MTLHEFIIKNSVLLKKECVVKREIIFDEGRSEVRTVYSGKLKKIPISLAKLIGSSRNTITAVETGQFCPSAYLAYLLCEALDCDFKDLFYMVKE